MLILMKSKGNVKSISLCGACLETIAPKEVQLLDQRSEAEYLVKPTNDTITEQQHIPTTHGSHLSLFVKC